MTIREFPNAGTQKRSAVPRLFQLYGTSLGLDRIPDRIPGIKSCFVSCYTEVVAGLAVLVQFKAGTGDTVGMNVMSKGV